MSGQNPREIALQVLQQRPAGEYIEDVLEKTLTESRLNSPDRHLCQELVYGVVRWRDTLDCLIAAKTAKTLQQPKLQNVLRLGLYQLFWLDRVPPHAAVHETVELAKHADLPFGLVNAVLRGYSRQIEPTRQSLLEMKSQQPHLGYSHPQWLVSRWQQRWSSDQVIRLLTWNNTPPKTFARVNTLKAEAGKLLAQWRDEGVEYDFVRRDWLEENLVFELKAHPPLARMASFEQGLFYVQDPSTLLAVRQLEPQLGERILDFCSAPGGKLTYLAQLQANQGDLWAHDTSHARLKRVEENCRRLGVTGVRLVGAPELERFVPAELPAESAGQRAGFDKILIDAPCSNTGVMRRRIDLRWRLRQEEINRLAVSQLVLLRQAAPLVREGGKLVYSTCSLEVEENDEMVRRFLEERPDFKLEVTRQLLPFVEEVDGAFVARFIRKTRSGEPN